MGSLGKQQSTGGPSPSPAPAWVRDLEELRNSVISRLVVIEDLARRRSSAPAGENARIVQTLREQIDELERDRERLRVEAERGEDWKRLRAQLENDRQLLAESWERLERERVDAGGNAVAVPARQQAAGHRTRPPDDHAPHTLSPTRTAASGETGNPVAETILRQFQVLCGDVRRTTDARCSSG